MKQFEVCKKRIKLIRVVGVLSIILTLIICSITEMPALAEEEVSNENEENRYYLGKLVNAGNNDGFSETNEVDKDDPHYEWQLGKFFCKRLYSTNRGYKW